MIRDDVKQKITRDLCIDWTMRTHINNVSYETLEVNSSGELREREEPSSNSWHIGTYVLFHTYGNVSCNCDWCAEWEHNLNNIQDKYESFSDYIRDCIENTGDTAEDYILERLREIPLGFFDDEK